MCDAEATRTCNDNRRLRDPAVRKKEILRAAGFAFAERGYAHVTLQEIGKVAGVTPALIVRYFGSKRELFARVSQWHTDEETAAWDVNFDLLADEVLTFWLNPEARAPALALIRSIDLDGGKLLERELEVRIRSPLRKRLSDEGDTSAKIRLLESLIMGIGLFGIEGLLGDPTHLNEAEVDSIGKRLRKVIAACIED